MCRFNKKKNIPYLLYVLDNLISIIYTDFIYVLILHFLENIFVISKTMGKYYNPIFKLKASSKLVQLLQMAANDVKRLLRYMMYFFASLMTLEYMSRTLSF